MWGDFHAHSNLACSTIDEEKWGTARSLNSKWHNEIKSDTSSKPGDNFHALCY